MRMKSTINEGDRLSWRDLRLELVWCYEGEPIGRKVRTHGLNLTAWLVLAGEAAVRIGGRTVKAKRGEWLVCRPMERWQDFSDSARIVSIHLALACPAQAGEWTGPAGVVLKNGAKLEQAAGRLRGTEALRPLALTERCNLAGLSLSLDEALELRAAVAEFAQRLSAELAVQGMRFGPAEIRDERVRASRLDLAGKELREGFSREALAGREGVSASQLDRLWREELGMTPRQYWERRRLETACEQLQNGTGAVKALAYELGFAHLSRFSIWFREKTGMTPRAYRRRPRMD
jgi:AraC-like DNA-binding protein